MFFPIETLADLRQFCASGAAEGLRLEFKEKEDPSTPAMSRTDKRNVAQAVSSFANSDGGMLILGVRTGQKEGADVAEELRPISDVHRFLAQVQLVCSLNISPELPSLSARAVLAEDGTSGFVICEVPRSDGRPHMSTATGVHSYYRRSFTGSVPMTPSEVRDQILAVRDAILEPTFELRGGSFPKSQGGESGWVAMRVPIRFGIKNVGRALCMNPFLRVRPSCEVYTPDATFDRALSAYKTALPYGSFIHVDDRQSAFTLALTAIIRQDLLQSQFQEGSTYLTEAVVVLPGHNEYQVMTISDKVSLERVTFDLQMGAENAPLTEHSIKFSRRDIAKHVLNLPEIADVSRHWWFPFRSDLVTQFSLRKSVAKGGERPA
jgi:hypothetical protein